MTGLRNRLAMKGHKALVLLLAVLGMHALVPMGHMLAADGAHGLTITLCPVTHPLARATTTKESNQSGVDHAAMGHASKAMQGHGQDDGKDDAPAPSATRGDTNCAFAATGLATLDATGPLFDAPLRGPVPLADAPLPDLAILRTERLRPPLRAPPILS